MITRSIGEIKLNPREHITGFQLYLGSLKSFSSIKTYDFSENKLKRLIKENQGNFMLVELLTNYLAGKVAVGWRNGNPVFIKVIKDK